MQNKAAREANRQFGLSTQEQKEENEMVDVTKSISGKRSYKKWHIRSFLNSVDRTLKEQGVRIPDKLAREVGVGAAAVFNSMFAVAVRDNSENPRVFCPKCKQYHTVVATAPCPNHPDEFPRLPCRVDNVNLERNSMQVAMKIFDKFLPTLQSVDNNINIHGTITTVSVQLTQILFKYVPVDKRQACFEEMNELLSAVQDADGDQPK
jgi:hypothetical protein